MRNLLKLVNVFALGVEDIDNVRIITSVTAGDIEVVVGENNSIDLIVFDCLFEVDFLPERPGIGVGVTEQAAFDLIRQWSVAVVGYAELKRMLLVRSKCHVEPLLAGSAFGVE